MNAIYWEDQHFGLWIAPNPLPGQTMDTLLQIEWRYDRRGSPRPDMMFRIQRADLIEAISNAKAFWAAWKQGISAVHDCGMFIALGDADFRYFITVSTRGGIWGGESKDDSKGVKISIERQGIPDAAPQTKRKYENKKEWGFQITASNFARLCAKPEV